jgi:glycoside/pentoside/hexuronide:cation symporter, GPH family
LTVATQPLTRGQIWAFATVAMPLGMLGLPLAIYLAPFYAGQLGLPLAMVGTALMLARLSDFVTDPIMGVITDRWRPSIGRRRIWLIFGTLIMMAGVQLLLRPPEGVGIVWFGLCVALVYLGYTTLQIPYEAWAGELSGDYHVRTRISATKQGFNIFGLVIATAIPAWVLSRPGATSAEVLDAIGIAILIVLPLTALLAFVRVPEPPPPSVQQKLDLKVAGRLMIANKPFRLLVIVVLIATIGEVFRQSITVFFARDVVGVSNIGIVYAVYFAVGLLAVPLWGWLAKRLEKHRTLILAFLIVAATNFAMGFLQKGDEMWFIALFVLKGICFGAIGILPNAMTADTVDIDTAQTGDRQQGIYFATLAMVQKLGFAIGGGVPLILLDVVGFNARGGSGPEALMWLKVFYAVIPGGLVLLAAGLLARYGLTEARQEELRGYIEARKTGQTPPVPAFLTANMSKAISEPGASQ